MDSINKKSIKINMVLNAIKGSLSIIFPLITFPYVSRLLGVDNLGMYNFAHSIISYFVLFAGLGISTYAIREGARIRDDKELIERFSCEIYSINMVSTLLSYCVLFISILVIPKLRDYRVLLIVFSFQIVFKTIGVEWLYSIYEDYFFITIRSILFQILSIVLLFLYVRNDSDVVKYAGITVFSSVGSNIINYLHSRKYCRIKLTNRIKWDVHLKPIIVLFAMTATITLYVSSDVTILGFICDDYTVGIYSVSTKVYTIVKTILSSVLVVSIPRLSSLLGKNDNTGFMITASDIYKTLISLVVPGMIGIIALRRDIVLLLSSGDYLEATSSLVLLAIALFFCMGAWFWGQCILVPYKKEKVVFLATLVGALVNVILNCILIPFWKENAAAVTTIIAECISFIWCGIVSRKQINISGLLAHYLKVGVGCLPIIPISIIVHKMDLTTIGNVLTIITASIILYVLIEIMLHNESIKSIVDAIKSRIFQKR